MWTFLVGMLTTIGLLIVIPYLWVKVTGSNKEEGQCDCDCGCDHGGEEGE